MTPIERALLRGDTATATAMAKRRASEKRDRAKRVRSRAPRAKGATKEERSAVLNANTARIREGCVLRAGGIGELCGRPLDLETMEMAHLDGGNGKRRQDQKIENCLMEHGEHHKSLDKFPLAWLDDVKRWAERYGYEVPRRFRKLEAFAQAKGGQRARDP